MNLEEKIDRLSESIDSLNKSVYDLQTELIDVKEMVYKNKVDIEKRNWALTTLIAAVTSIFAFIAGKIF